MKVTRDKRVINLGVQPVIKNVQPSANTRDMLSVDPKRRGHMINLKKILQPFLNDKMKALGLKLQVANAMLLYSGIDAANYHFANKAIHTPFIEFVLCKIDCHKPADLEKVRNEMVATALVWELKEILSALSTDESCIVTREILRDCKTDASKYFEVCSESPERMSIDFVYGVNSQPFIEIRTLPELRVPILEKYGIFFMPLGYIVTDINIGMSKYGTADWKFRESTLRQCLERSGLSLSFWTFVGLVRRCFPMLAMRKMGVAESVTEMIQESCRNSPSHNGEIVRDLEARMLEELADCKNDKLLASLLSFNELYERCSLLGLMPEDIELRNNLDNTYNNTHMREVRISSLSQK
uniref:Uncharacterized protein n=1 Tax=viral metagenome TaxID=1070528 RepID=A0A6C0CIM7_9ZZZZ